MMFSVITASPEQTEQLGAALGSLLSPGDLLCLYGDLGAGKTSFTCGIALGLDVREPYVTSPTFAFVNEYQGRIPLYHIDLYRLNDPGELESIGFEEYIDSDGATVIEWAERAEDEIPDERLNIYFSHTSEVGREIGFQAEGERHAALMAALRGRVGKKV